MNILSENLNEYIEDLIKRYPILQEIKENIIDAYFTLERCFENGGQLLIAGNGGSAADSEHIVGELMKGFKKDRNIDYDLSEKLISIDKNIGTELSKKLQKGLPAIALSNHSALTTAYLNDVDGKLCFAQQVNCYGKEGDVFLAISTSGNAENVFYAAITAKAKGMKIITLSGKDGGLLKNISDIAIVAPAVETYIIQELHLPIYHCICLMLEEKFFV